MAFSFKSHHGKYLSCDPSGRLTADKDHCQAWEIFQAEKHGHNLSLYTAHGKWVCAEPSGKVIADRDQRQEWETFHIHKIASHKWALKSAHGKFLCAEKNGSVVANRDKADDWETWTVNKVAKPGSGSSGGSSGGLKNGEWIVLKSAASGKSLQCLQDGNVKGLGTMGEWASFIVHVDNEGVKLQNVGNKNHWLRIDDKGNTNGGGNGGPWCIFEVIPNQNGTVSFRSREFKKHHNDNWHLGILKNGDCKPGRDTGTGINGQFTIVRLNHVNQGDKVHLRSAASGKNFQCMGDGSCKGLGQTGGWATFVVHREGEYVKFQNEAKPEHWLRIDDKGNTNGGGNGGPWCLFEIIPNEGNTVSFRSVEFKKHHNDNWHLGILPNGDCKPGRDTGTGLHGRFTILRK